ncbi:MAG: hypothetical protein QOI98_2967, partial [Solirubrobacteraceae bacterium]|nr:hypothetical protein [Solirubrobacteraceae bacterium]
MTEGAELAATPPGSDLRAQAVALLAESGKLAARSQDDHLSAQVLEERRRLEQ